MTEANTTLTTGPSAFMRESLIPEAEFAAALGKSLRTVRRWASLRQGPTRMKLGQAIFYTRKAIEGWLASQERPCRRRRALDSSSRARSKTPKQHRSTRRSDQTLPNLREGRRPR